MNSEVAPRSRGAPIVEKVELERFLDERVRFACARQTVGAFLLVRVSPQGGGLLSKDQMARAVYLLAQLARQGDQVAEVDERTVAIVVSRLSRRSDAHVLLGRIESSVNIAGYPWELASGVGVFPMCGSRGNDAWAAACRDLAGASSSDSWVHEVPRETLRTNQAC